MPTVVENPTSSVIPFNGSHCYIALITNALARPSNLPASFIPSSAARSAMHFSSRETFYSRKAILIYE